MGVMPGTVLTGLGNTVKACVPGWRLIGQGRSAGSVHG